MYERCNDAFHAARDRASVGRRRRVILRGVKGSSRALFHAVVVMGAGLAACAPASQSSPAAEPTGVRNDRAERARPDDGDGPKDRVDGAGEAKAGVAGSGGEDVPKDRDAAAGEAKADEGEAKVDVGEAKADGGEAKAVKPKKQATKKKRECPEGSERPVPPCFYIL